jgi:hypothetical protein
MKMLLASSLAILFLNGAFAEVSLPYGIEPLNGEIRLLFKPEFESTCITKNESDPNDLPSKSVTKLFLDTAGRLKLEMRFDNGSILADVNHDGSKVLKDSFKFDFQDQTKNDTAIPDFIDKMLKNLGKVYTDYSPIGKTLRQSSDLSATDLCEIFPGGSSSFFSTFKKRVIGLTQINGRSSLILQSDVKTSCTFPKLGQIAISGYAWEAYDLQSGLNSDSGGNMRLTIGTNPEVNMSTTSSCVIASTAQATTSPKGKSTEQRLIELKSLMDKGLINQEQYEQKRTEILKSL